MTLFLVLSIIVGIVAFFLEVQLFKVFSIFSVLIYILLVYLIYIIKKDKQIKKNESIDNKKS